MNIFKEGDEVWFFYTNYGRKAWDVDDTVIYPQEIELENGHIVNINKKKDYVHIYVPECDKIVNIGWSYIE